MKLLKIKILFIVTVLMFSFAYSSREATIGLKELWQVGNSWGFVSKSYFSNGTLDSQYYTNYTIKNTSTWQNEKVFVVRYSSNGPVVPMLDNSYYQFYDFNNHSLVGGFSEKFSSSGSLSTIIRSTMIIQSNGNELNKEGSFNDSGSTKITSYYNYSGSDVGNQSAYKSILLFNSTYLAQVTSENKSVQDGSFECWKIESKPLVSNIYQTRYQMNNVTTGTLSTLTYQYFENNTYKVISTSYQYNSTTRNYIPTNGFSQYYDNISNTINTVWISKTLNMEIAYENQYYKEELIYINIKQQPLNLLLPVTLILLGGFTIGTIYVLVELIAYRKTTKNIKHGNFASFLSYLKEKTFRYTKKREQEKLSEKTLQKMEEIIKENEK